MSDYFDRVESELRAAVTRSSPRSGRPPRRRPSVGGAVLVLAAAGSVALAVLAIALLSHGRGRSLTPVSPAPRVTSPQHTRESDAQLRNLLGVLRRPQTMRDRAFPSGADPTAVPGLTRLATTLSDGTRAFVIVDPTVLSAALIEPNGHGAVDGTAGGLDKRGKWSITMLPDGFPSSSRHRAIYISLVPDGVARVRWSFPAGLTFAVRVRNNVAVRLIKESAGRDPSSVTWYSSTGRIIASCRGRACAGG